MNEVVMDSSIVMAILKNEKIDHAVHGIFGRAVMSTVNVAEIYTKLSELKMSSLGHVDALLSALGRIEAFTPAQAKSAGLLRDRTSHAGLSLGDRACLALALELGAEVYTTDRAWARVDIGVRIHLLR